MASDGEQYESVGDEHHSDDDDDDNNNIKRDDDSSPSIERRQAAYEPADDTYECLADNQSNASSADGRGRDSDQGRRADDSDDDSERAGERRTSDGADRMSDTGHLSDRRSVDENIYDEVRGQEEVHELQQQQQHQLQQHDDDERHHIDAQKATSSEAPAAHVNRENVRIQETKKESAAGRFVIRSSRQLDAMYYLDNIINEEDRRRGIDATKEVVSRRLTTNKDSIHVVATPKSHPSPLAATSHVAAKSPLAATSPVAAKSPVAAESPESPTSPSITHNTAQQNVKVTKEVKVVKPANSAVNSDSPLSPGAQGPQSPPAQWRMDIEERKKSKSYVVAHKPEQPLRLGLVPEWKKQLQDKTKVKKMSSVDGYENGSVTSPDSTKASPVSPWKLEIEQLKKMSVASPADDDSQNEPEWVKVQQEKRTAKGAVGEKNK